MSALSVDQLLNIAEATALQAGACLQQNRGSWKSVETAVGRDIKLAADKASEAVIIAELQRQSDYPILSEESGHIAGTSDARFWVVDPLDGSMNYHQNIPFCCVSIALYAGDTPILGVVYDFNREEMFTGIVEVGAWLNGVPIRTSDIDTPGRAVLVTGFPVQSDFSTASLMKFAEEIQQFKKIRLLGSAALSLSYVACGRADIYQENRIMFWDVAAGCALVKSAGGSVSVYAPDSDTAHRVVCATNGKLKISS